MMDMLRKIKGEKSELTHTPVGGSVNYWLPTAKKTRVFIQSGRTQSSDGTTGCRTRRKLTRTGEKEENTRNLSVE